MHIADRKLFQKSSYFIHIEELLSGHPNRSAGSQHVQDQYLTKGFMVKYNPHNHAHAKYCIAVGTADYQNKAAPEGLNQALLRRYHTMKYMKDLKKALSHHIGVIEESMAQYVECQDRIRHIKTLNWR